MNEVFAIYGIFYVIYAVVAIPGFLGVFVFTSLLIVGSILVILHYTKCLKKLP